jgi:hypothetical protein
MATKREYIPEGYIQRNRFIIGHPVAAVKQLLKTANLAVVV